jgi:hypothetical protein
LTIFKRTELMVAKILIEQTQPRCVTIMKDMQVDPKTTSCLVEDFNE